MIRQMPVPAGCAAPYSMAALRGLNPRAQIVQVCTRTPGEHPLTPTRLSRRPLTYFHVTRQYCGTQVDYERSLFDYTRGGTCNHCHSGIIECVRGLFIDESSWTGEDMFIAWGKPGSIIVTDRVRQMRDKYSLTNMNLTPTEEYLWDPLYKWTPIDYSRDEIAVPDEDDDGTAPN